MDIPGLLEACRGYDTPMGNPHPSKGHDDPGYFVFITDKPMGV